MPLNCRALVSFAVLSAFFVACGDEDDDFIPDPYGDVDVIDGGPTDETPGDPDGDIDGDGDGDGGGDATGDVDAGDGDGGPTDNDPPPVYGLDERPSQQTCKAFTAPPVTDQVSFVDRFPGVRFSTPVSMTQRPNDNSRIFVNERAGRIYSFPNEPTATNAQRVLALDLSDVLTTRYDCATASLQFPPDFATSGVAYVAYCHRFPNTAGGSWPYIQARLSRFYSTDGGLHFDRASEQVLIAINYVIDTEPAGDGYTRSCTHSDADAGLHAGNAAHFGSDGYLYWAVGDGGPQGHCGGKQAQSLSSLRGKLLRMDVSDLSKQIDPSLLDYVEGLQYTAVDIPIDNPFFGPDPNPTDNIEPGVIQPLIYAYGFRNPWQWSFDPQDGKIWLGDVGNGTWEEINRDIEAGANYGWGFFEGYYCANGWGGIEYPDDGAAPVVPACTSYADDANLRWPMLQYRHGPSYDVTDPPPSTPPAFRLPDNMYGRAVTGGVVYRGTAIPTHRGSYFFADSSTARIWEVRGVDDVAKTTGSACTSTADCGPGLVCKANELPYENGFDPNVVWNNGGAAPTGLGRCTADYEFVQGGLAVASFARDQNNEIYAVALNGYIAMLRATPATGGTGGPPDLLSQTGCFTVVDDGGTTTVTEPVDDLVPFAPAAELWSDGATKRRWLSIPDGSTITTRSDGDFDFPIGSVLVKEFSLAGQRVETRFFVRQVEDGRWAAYTYEWDDSQTDATLVPENGLSKLWGAQTWSYPGRQQCFQCHNTVAGTVLGPETAQLNHDLIYPATGRTANQMLTLEHLGLVDTTVDPAPWSALAPIADTSRTVEDRARSYLHANCSNCHRPDGPTFTDPDMRYSTAFASMNVCNAPPNISAMEDVIDGPSTLLTPGDAEHSQIYKRPETTNAAYRMPPLATSIPHTAALEVLETWINSITTCE